jgi:hypothetical protein
MLLSWRFLVILRATAESMAPVDPVGNQRPSGSTQLRWEASL